MLYTKETIMTRLGHDNDTIKVAKKLGWNTEFFREELLAASWMAYHEGELISKCELADGSHGCRCNRPCALYRHCIVLVK